MLGDGKESEEHVELCNQSYDRLWVALSLENCGDGCSHHCSESCFAIRNPLSLNSHSSPPLLFPIIALDTNVPILASVAFINFGFLRESQVGASPAVSNHQAPLRKSTLEKEQGHWSSIL